MDEILQKSGSGIDEFSKLDKELNTLKFTECFKTGHFKINTKDLEGIGRKVFIAGGYDTNIQEGYFVNNKLNGFGRVIYPNGDYYVGTFKNHQYNGSGQFVNAKGDILQG